MEEKKGSHQNKFLCHENAAPAYFPKQAFAENAWQLNAATSFQQSIFHTKQPVKMTNESNVS